jgi:hypothetical protein
MLDIGARTSGSTAESIMALGTAELASLAVSGEAEHFSTTAL